MGKQINPYDDKWTPLFDALPKGLNVADRATFGQIKRRCDMTGKKCTASAQTIAGVIGASEKTVDRAFAKLMKYGLIKCIFNGKASRTPSHYIVNAKSSWKLKELDAFSKEKSNRISTAKKKSLGTNCPETRVNLSGTRVNLSHKDTEDTSTRYPENSNFNSDNEPITPFQDLPVPLAKEIPAQKNNSGRIVTKETKKVSYYQEEPAE